MSTVYHDTIREGFLDLCYTTADDVRRLESKGTTKEAIARIAGIRVAGVYRILADRKRTA